MMLAEALEAGLVTTPGDHRVHAVRITLDGPEALCGAGRVTLRVPGRFAFADGAPCHACLAAALPRQRVGV